MYTKLFSGEPNRFQAPMDLSLWNAVAFLALDEDRPDVLADLADTAVQSLLDTSNRRHQDDLCPYQGAALTVGTPLVGALTFEYLLHCFDMIRAVDCEWVCAEAAADAALAVMGPLMVSLFDPAASGDLRPRSGSRTGTVGSATR